MREIKNQVATLYPGDVGRTKKPASSLSTVKSRGVAMLSGKISRRLVIFTVSLVLNLIVVLGFSGIGHSQPTYHEVHAFQLDGSTPVAGLIQASDGNLYTTTRSGGAFNGGTVYKISTGGTVTLLHS